MTLLSIFWGYCSGVALLKEGVVLAAVSEERFSRIKNDSTFPINSINWLFQTFSMNSKDIDKIIMVSNDVGTDYIILKKNEWTVSDYLYENHHYWKEKLLNGVEFSKDLFFDVMSHKIDVNQYPKEYWTKKVEERNFNSFGDDKNYLVANFFGLSEESVMNIEHHRSHAYYSYYSSNFIGEKTLAFTADGWGDGKNGTVGMFNEDGTYEILHTYTNCNIARIYRYMTLLLGMKPSEHEYKVMGLAPYGKSEHAQKALEVFKSTLYVDGLEFKWKIQPTDSYFWFKERLEGVRFDSLAWALQEWTEDILCQWVKNVISYYKVRKIVFSGGVSMNVKAMGKIGLLDEVESIFIGGSAGDESHIIGAALCAYTDLQVAKKNNKPWNPFSHLFLGPEFFYDDEKQIINKIDNLAYEIIENYKLIDVVNLLLNGNIIARRMGKLEFGQRSLGNSSILADPSRLDIKDKINSAIKNRDFWMPFAPVILDTFVSDYLVNPKELRSPYMTLAFKTTSKGYEAMKAACHPSDKTCRAQILEEESNPQLYSLLSIFAEKSGRGALMNTSFNLHGYPIVNSPSDALYVFENSHLDALMLNHYLIIKKKEYTL